MWHGRAGSGLACAADFVLLSNQFADLRCLRWCIVVCESELRRDGIRRPGALRWVAERDIVPLAN